MKDKKNPSKPKAEPVVVWVHRPWEGAEDEFWRIYLKLGLEAVLDAMNKKTKEENDHDQA